MTEEHILYFNIYKYFFINKRQMLLNHKKYFHNKIIKYK